MAMDFSEGLLTTILQQLPTDCLCRFKCVSKSWHDLIISLPKQDVLVKREVKSKETGENEVIFSFLKYPFTGDDDNDDESIISRFGQDLQHVGLHDHSHGIMCFSNGFDHIFLCNPATGELRKLPPSILTFPNNISSQGLYSFMKGIGFGYDSKSKDFKVVRIVEFYTHIQDCSRPPRAEVYDLEKDGWREIKTLIPADVSRMSSFHMYHQGCYYWWADAYRHGGSSAEVIQCFDFTKEVFGLISMPDGLDNDYKSLGILNESIVLFKCPFDVNEQGYDVWKMVKDDDDAVSWTKLFTFGPLFGVYIPLAFLSSDELLMEDEGRLTLCNIFNTRYRKQLPIKGKFMSIEASLFVKTAMSVKRGITTYHLR